MKKKTVHILLGVFAAFCAVLLVLRVTGVADARLPMRGWWTLFLIVPGVMALHDRVWKFFPLLGVIAGTLLFIAANRWISYRLAVLIAVPLCAGAVLLWPRLENALRRHDVTGPAKTKWQARAARRQAFPQYAASFEKKTVVPGAAAFQGALVGASFGEVTLDLREKTLAQGAEICVFAVFARVRILLPDHVDVILRVTPLLSVVKDDRPGGGVPMAGVNLTGTAIFSEVRL